MMHKKEKIKKGEKTETTLKKTNGEIVKYQFLIE